MNENQPQQMELLLLDAIGRMLMCRMPDAMRVSLEALIARPDATAYELKSAYESNTKHLVLSLPRQEIHWNPTVDADKCVGCEVCYHYCPHGVYRMENSVAVVAHPSECVILCSHCMPRCTAQAISFPPQKEYVEFLRYE